VFFTGVVPRFVPAHDNTVDLLILGGVFNAIGIAWLVGYATLVARAKIALSQGKTRRMIERLSGIVLIGFAVDLALTPRG
ncbi:MAG: LysE family transporter, partial [Solirubrobacterales bacterium]|nr:LysE family transporter [Solirubrobacterales bacterium]